MLPFYIIKRISPIRKKLAELYADRAQQIVPKIEPLLQKNEKILDIGSGTGAIAKYLQKKGFDVTLADVAHNEMCDVYPIVIYNGKKLPFEKNQFSTSLLIAVLHHCNDPSTVLDEAIRVSSKRIIIMEDIFTDILGRVITFIGDCLVNFEIHSPFKNHTKKDWIEIFKQKNLSIVKIQEFKLICIGFPFKLVIFELKKI